MMPPDRLPARPKAFTICSRVDFKATELFSAQLAEVPNGFFTSLKLLNTATANRTITLRAISDKGELLAAPATIQLPAGGIIEKDVSEIFSTASQLVGSLRVAADGQGIVGDVVFGDPVSLGYAAALSLQPQGSTQAIFSQVANAAGYYTGLALYNPGQESSDVRISVFKEDESMSGETSLALPGGHRLSKLLYQVVKESADQVGGYIIIRSTLPLISQALFSDWQDMLAAIPPTVLK